MKDNVGYVFKILLQFFKVETQYLILLIISLIHVFFNEGK